MTLPLSGILRLSDIRAEASVSGTINFGNSTLRELANKPSGSISISDFYNKTAVYKPSWAGASTMNVSLTRVTRTVDRYIGMTSGTLYESFDGITWTALTTTVSGRYDVCAKGQTIIACGYTGSGGSNAYRSLDSGASWTTGTNALYSGANEIVFGSNNIVVVCDGQINYSTNNGASWTYATVPSPPTLSNYYYKSVASSPSGILVATAQGTGNLNGKFYMAYSTNDGVSWSLGSHPNTSPIGKVAYGADTFIHVVNNTAYWSTNASSWTAVSSGFTTGCHSVAYNGTLFIAVSVGKCAYSYDGKTWALSTSYPTSVGAFGASDIAIGSTEILVVSGTLSTKALLPVA